MPTVHLIITGKVQGVFYRATAKDIAEKNGLAGWVRNTKQGAVEARVSGTETQISDFIAWCKQGPSQAVVKNVEATKVKDQDFEGFRIVNSEW